MLYFISSLFVVSVAAAVWLLVGNVRLRGLLAVAEARFAAEQELRRQEHEHMGALSQEVVQAALPLLARQAQTSFEKHHQAAQTDLQLRHQKISELIAPLNAQLKTYQAQLQSAEQQNNKNLGQLQQQLQHLHDASQILSEETKLFRSLLHASPHRGRWGEVTLQRLLETTGLLQHCDFQTQAVGENLSRPDVVLRLPQNRMVVIDAKTPDLQPLQEADRADAAGRARLLALYAKKLRETILALAKRNYPANPEFANALPQTVLFLPAESLLSAALQADGELLIYAQTQNVLLATPATLLSLLGAVNVCWQQQEQQENARRIADTAGELHKRTAVFFRHFGKLRAGLCGAVEAFNDSLGSYQRSVLPQTRKLEKMHTSLTPLPEFEPLHEPQQPPQET